jgi:UDP-N-acetylmuramate dehydrogenase
MMAYEASRFVELRGSLRRDEPMWRHTSWRCGGPADVAYVPADVDDLRRFVAQLPKGEPLEFIGLGSNLLVRDGGIRGTVILLHAALNAVGFDDGLIRAEAGVASPKVARFAATHDRVAAEFLAGVPGTIGGALAMNAGCYGSETWDYVVKVATIDRGGRLHERTASDYEIGYRSVRRRGRQDLGGEIFVAGWFAFPQGDGSASRARISELLKKRIASQPLGLPNAGSVFRNPPGDHAARLIESCGLKGFAIGGARVSEKHANFIVNPEGQGRAADIEALIAHVRQVVLERTGIALEQEVRIIGEAA